MIGASWIVGLVLIASAGEPTVPSIKEVLSVPSITSVTISRDGATIAYQERVADWEDNRFHTEIRLIRGDEEAFAFTRSDKGSSSPSFSPDGGLIAFLSNRDDEGPQVWVAPIDGGEARRLTSHDGGVERFEWSPKGDRLAFLARDPEIERDKAIARQYGDFRIEDETFRNSHLWLVDFDRADLSAAKPVRLTSDGESSVGSFSFSPDGGLIVFDHQPTPSVDDFVRADVAVVDVDFKRTREIATSSSVESQPMFSPDGDWLVYVSSEEANPYYGNRELVLEPSGGGETRVLTGSFDENPQPIAWTRQGIWFVSSQRTDRHLFVIDPQSLEIQEIDTLANLVSGVAVAADSETIAVVGSRSDSLPEVVRIAGNETSVLTDYTDEVAGWPLGEPKLVTWTSRDGQEIEGVLHLPPDHDPSVRAPLLVVIHGGPTGTSRPYHLPRGVYPMVKWLNEGAMILMPNYRGSAGYGGAFRALNVRNLGVGDAWDVESGVLHLIDEGLADPERVGAMGWSQGGYISAFLSTNSTLFKAISNGAGISNWMTYYVNTDIHGFTRNYLEATPWEDPEIYAKTSPMTNITKAQTPTLIQHGENDARVPPPNAYELYQGLRDVGVETQLVIYERFGHGINRPKEQLAANWHNYQWFAKHLWGRDVELPLDDPDEADESDEDDEAEGSESSADGGEVDR